MLVRFAGLFTDLNGSTWDDEVIEGIEFIQHSVLQVPFFLMSLMRYLNPAMDNMFMDSLQWVDQTYIAKHKTEDPASLRAMYYPNLHLYSTHGSSSQKRDPYQAMTIFLTRFLRKAGLSLGVYLLSFLPVVGRFVLPAASCYTFYNAVGIQPAVLVFGSSLFVPKRYIVVFLQSYFSSRSLMRELVSPSTQPKISLIYLLLRLLPARTILQPNALHFRSEETLVPRPLGSVVRFRVRVFHFSQDPLAGGSHLRHSRSIHGLSHHQNY